MTSILKVDVDFKAPEEWLEAWLETREAMIEKYLNLSILRVVRHETTKGQNYFIEVEGDEDLSPEQINMIQFLLGDDHTRCKINAWRIERGVPHWNKIFDRKLWRKGATVIECFYCGNKIPLISHEPLENGKEVDAIEEKKSLREKAREAQEAADAEKETPVKEPKEEPEPEPETETEPEPETEPETEPEGEPEEPE